MFVPTDTSDLDNLFILGSKSGPQRKLEAFPNHSPQRHYLVTLKTDEFTCVCPKTGNPDFARIRIWYVPDKKIVESKSLKLYLWSFRNEGVFHEHLVNQILDDLVEVIDPHWCLVKGVFNIRGGIGIDVHAEHVKTEEVRNRWIGVVVRERQGSGD
ncbi:MAG: NADPH-dependent 7-cyano-7-deazaguanine reductase QueF [Spirochaetales bacterium]|nr:NADPH-dependent 7-cyano-7-deazaguanine reductase QueF [Spirochaetales bacterium]